MNESPIADRIRDRWQELTKSDRLVARRLLDDYPVAGLKTLAELAGRAGVSAPSVIRCVKKLGFDSYPAFQRALHDEVQESFERFSRQGGAEVVRSELTDLEMAYAESVRKTVRRTLDGDARQLAALLTRPRSTVLCLGGRISQALAMVFQAHLLRLRPNVELVSSNAVERAERLMDVGRNDVVVVFDFKPWDSQTVSFAKLAADCDAKVVCFTGDEPSPAAEHATVVLRSDNRAGDTAVSFTAAMCATEIVLEETRSRVGSRARSRGRSMADAPATAVGLPLDPNKA